jgi:hypothetical protein
MSVSFEEIAGACRVLFGPDTPTSPAFVEYLRVSGLKAAFRALAKASHPDRAQTLGVEPGALAAEFRRVRAAYELLLPFVSRAQPIPDPLPPRIRGAGGAVRPAACGGAVPAVRTDWRYEGSLPSRPLRFGEFLFYTRRIGWRDLVGAIVWQTRHRPRLGEYALERGWISAQSLCLIRRHARPNELWGETAMRLGLLDARQLAVLLGTQHMQGPAFGRFFVATGRLTEHELAALVLEQQRHNRRCAGSWESKRA